MRSLFIIMILGCLSVISAQKTVNPDGQPAEVILVADLVAFLNVSTFFNNYIRNLCPGSLVFDIIIRKYTEFDFT